MRRRRSSRDRRDDAALTSVINLMLATALVVTTLNTVVVSWEPQMSRQVEARHHDTIGTQMAGFVTSLDGLAGQGQLQGRVHQRIDLGSASQAIFTSSRTHGTLGFAPPLPPPSGPLGAVAHALSGTYVAADAAQFAEGALGHVDVPRERVLAGLDRASPGSLAGFQVRFTDLAHLASADGGRPFRIAAVDSGVCVDAACPVLDLAPSQCPDRVPGDTSGLVWAVAFFQVSTGVGDAAQPCVWTGGSDWVPAEKTVGNGETLNLLCHPTALWPLGSWDACPAVPPKPRSLLEADLQLWPTLYGTAGLGVPGHVDVWFADGHAAFGTFEAVGGEAAGLLGGVGLPPLPALPAVDLPLVPERSEDRILVVTIDTSSGPPRSFLVEHGALLIQENGRIALLLPPPFVFSKDPDSGVIRAHLRMHNLQGDDLSTGGTGPVTLASTLLRQHATEGEAGELRLRLQTHDCAAWETWFRGEMERLGLVAGAGFTTHCDTDRGLVTLHLLGPDRGALARDLHVEVLWSDFELEVQS